MKQMSLATGFEKKSKRTRKREFLDEMDLVVHWHELVTLIESHSPPKATGRPAFAVESMLRMRSAYYPVVKPDENQFGLPGHTDLSFLTLILPATAPRLQILTAAGTWLDQPIVDGGILVNTGDTLRTWAND